MSRPAQTKPATSCRAGIGALIKKLLIVLAVVATIAWIVGLIGLLVPEV